jgi:hypothetical protein
LLGETAGFGVLHARFCGAGRLISTPFRAIFPSRLSGVNSAS